MLLRTVVNSTDKIEIGAISHRCYVLHCKLDDIFPLHLQFFILITFNIVQVITLEFH